MNLRMLANRVVNFARPKPQMIPLTAGQILADNQGKDLVERMNDLLYSSGAGGALNWKGMQFLKTPCDLWMYVELLQRLRPAALVETGTHQGGSATFFADMAATLGIPCTVVTVDINPKWSYDPTTKGIVSLIGYSTDEKIAEQVRAAVGQALARHPGHVLVTLDSDHSEANVLRELALYAPLVTAGSYLVVEDTNVNGHPSFPTHGPGPYEAVEKFLAQGPSFAVDLECQRFLLTSNPRGWLKRVK